MKKLYSALQQLPKHSGNMRCVHNFGRKSQEKRKLVSERRVLEWTLEKWLLMRSLVLNSFRTKMGIEIGGKMCSCPCA
jgi:hypothetical protein